MTESFKKIKNKFVLKAALFSCLLGLCAALFSAGVALVAVKLSQTNLAWFYYLIIGGGAFLLGCGVTLALIFPTNKKIAKQLDKDYDLGERVQTMLEFSDVDSDLTIMQREEAAQRLASLPAKKPNVTRVICCAASALICVGVFLTGVLLPANEQELSKDPPSADEPDFEITNWQVTALNQLMDEVKSSDLSDGVKNSCVAILQSLLEGLQDKQSESVMKAAVRSAISLVSGVMDGANSYNKLCEELDKQEAISNLTTPIIASAICYRADGVSITQFSQVAQKAEGLNESITAILTEGTKFISEGTTGLRGNALSAKLKTYTEAITSALQSSELDADDDLFAAVSALGNQLNSVITSVSMGGYTLSALQNLIVVACNDFAANGAEALSVQAYNCMMGEYINARLASIFSIVSDVADEDDGNSDDQSSGEEDKNSSGGYGDKNENYGSDDLIFFPDDETYVKYGEVLDAYFAKMQEIISNGDLSEELVRYIGNYFDILYSGLQSDTEQESQENQQNLQDGN